MSSGILHLSVKQLTHFAYMLFLLQLICYLRQDLLLARDDPIVKETISKRVNRAEHCKLKLFRKPLGS